MVRIACIGSVEFDDTEEEENEVVVNGSFSSFSQRFSKTYRQVRTQVAPRHLLDPRHLIKYFKQLTMQAEVVVCSILDELDQAGKYALGIHQLECLIIFSPVQE